MQISRLAPVLIAVLLPVASAVLCTESTMIDASETSIKEFTKISEALEKVTRDVMPIDMDALPKRLMRRQEGSDIYMPVNCNINEKCIDLGALVCYDEATTVARSTDGITVTLKNGDMILPDGTKANAFKNTEPIKRYLSGMLEKAAEEISKNPELASMMSQASNSIPTRTSSASTSSSTADADKEDDKEDDKKDDKEDDKKGKDEESKAGRTVVSGFVAGVAALAAVVLI